MELGFTSIDLQPIFNSQSITWASKMKDGRYLWAFQIWHEKLLPEEDDVDVGGGSISTRWDSEASLSSHISNM